MVKHVRKFTSKMSSKFAEWLNNKMLEQGLNQSELAKKSGLSRQTISYWMSGNAKRPDEKALQKLAKGLDIHPEEAYEAAAILPPADKEDAWTRSMMHRINQLTPSQRKMAEWLINKLANDEDL